MDQLKSTSGAYRHYHSIAKNWASDVEFFRIESAFLHRLLEGHFIKISNNMQSQALKTVSNELFQLEKEKQQADLLLVRHLKELDGQTADLVFAESAFISANHDELEKIMAQIGREYRKVKTKLFELVEVVISDPYKQ